MTAIENPVDTAVDQPHTEKREVSAEELRAGLLAARADEFSKAASSHDNGLDHRLKAALATVLPEGAELNEVFCRTTICRLKVTVPGHGPTNLPQWAQAMGTEMPYSDFVEVTPTGDATEYLVFAGKNPTSLVAGQLTAEE